MNGIDRPKEKGLTETGKERRPRRFRRPFFDIMLVVLIALGVVELPGTLLGGKAYRILLPPPVLSLTANVGETYRLGQIITLTATVDTGTIIGGPEYSPGQTFQAVARCYNCKAAQAKVRYVSAEIRDAQGNVIGQEWDDIDLEATLSLTAAIPTPPPTPQPTPQPTPEPTLAPTPCPPHLPGQTVVVSLSWTDEGSIAVEIPHIGKIVDIPVNYEMTGSAKFVINNTCPSITIPDGIRTDALNIPSVSLPLVVGSVEIDAELVADLIGQQVSSPSCGDGGSMSKYSATAVANTKLTISVTVLFWGTKVDEENYPFGEDIPVEVKTKCVYCPECD